MQRYRLGQEVRITNMRTGRHYVNVGEPFWMQDGPGPRYKMVLMPDGTLQSWDKVKSSPTLFQDMLK